MFFVPWYLLNWLIKCIKNVCTACIHLPPNDYNVLFLQNVYFFPKFFYSGCSKYWSLFRFITHYLKNVPTVEEKLHVAICTICSQWYNVRNLYLPTSEFKNPDYVEKKYEGLCGVWGLLKGPKNQTILDTL